MKETLVPVALFLAFAFVAWIVIASIRGFVIARLQAGVQTRLLERFHTAESLIAYGETETGRQFLTSLMEDRQARTSPYHSILTGVQIGIVMIVFGLTLLYLHHAGVTPADAVLVFGAVPVGLGIGFLLAATATWLLSKRFGLLEKERT